MPKTVYVVSGKVIIHDEQGRVLLLQRSPASKGNPGKWEFPGGKVDPGKAIDNALVREVREETGLTVTLDGSFGTCESKLGSRRVIYLVMEATATTSASANSRACRTIPVSPGRKSSAWAKWNTAAGTSSASWPAGNMRQRRTPKRNSASTSSLGIDWTRERGSTTSRTCVSGLRHWPRWGTRYSGCPEPSDAFELGAGAVGTDEFVVVMDPAKARQGREVRVGGNATIANVPKWVDEW